jgi:hypothetical protein
MFGVQRNCVAVCSRHWQIHSLLDAGKVAGRAHDLERLPAVGGIADVLLKAIPGGPVE